MEANNLGSYLTATQEEVDEAARDRIDSNAPFSQLTNRQKRLVLYLKLFRFLYGIGRSGVRIPLPRCLVARIRRLYHDEGEDFDEESDS